MSPLPAHFFLVAAVGLVGMLPFLLICFAPARSRKETT